MTTHLDVRLDFGRCVSLWVHTYEDRHYLNANLHQQMNAGRIRFWQALLFLSQH